MTGTFGDIACFSFHPRKVVTTGEGGALVIKDSSLFERAKEMRSHGLNASQEIVSLGYNYRMTEVQACLGVAQMKQFNDIWQLRRDKAYVYHEVLSSMENIILPIEPSGHESNYQSYVIQFQGDHAQEKRDEHQGRQTRQLGAAGRC